MALAVRIMVGDCREVLRRFPDRYFHCVITSPPYWGLRDYGVEPVVWGGDPDCRHDWGAEVIKSKGGGIPPDGLGSYDGYVGRGPRADDSMSQFCLRCGAWLGSLGLEPDPEMFVEHLVEIFREARRTLRDDGTLWLNLGSSYASGGRGTSDYHQQKMGTKTGNAQALGRKVAPGGWKDKDLIPIPWMVAMALQRDGWWLRQEITWCKTNPMPESIRDRPTKATESIFLLSKSKRYFYDKYACLEPLAEASLPRAKRGVSTSNKWSGGAPGSTAHTISQPRPNIKHQDSEYGGGGAGFQGHSGYYAADGKLLVNPAGRNLWNYWVFPTTNYPGAHFAVFPEEIPRRAILLGTSEGGCCPKCGAPWERVVDYEARYEKREAAHQPNNTPTKVDSTGWQQPKREFIGWQPTCSCNAEDVAPCRVLDLFSGAGTTGLVAEKLGRDSVLIDIKPEYAKMSKVRILEELGQMFTEITIEEAG